jgi:ring-1,2-phenylacetyl-CoA epoxidase subunit PaaE
MTTDQAPAPVRHRATFHSLRVAAIEPLTDEAIAITFDVPEDLAEEYTFTQGQHLTLRREFAGEEVRRNYSICSRAGSGVLRVAVKRLEGGMFSEWAHGDLAPGDRIDVLTPIGHFHTPLDPARARHYVAIAAGSGITPVLSLLTTALEVEPESTFTLVYGNRTTQSIMFLEELEDYKNRHPTRLELIHVLSREPQDVDLFTGRIDAEKLRALLGTLISAEAVDEWYLCGPYEMVEALRPALADAGVDPAHVHFELFHVEDAPPPARRRERPAGAEPDSTVTITLDGRASTFPLDRDGDRILDAALRVRNDAPYACKGGVCGTCRAKLVEGEVEMERNFALEPDEVADGFVLACQSHPVSERVVLDFDQ